VKTVFHRSFERDLKKIKERTILNRVKQVIEEVEASNSLQHISGLKKMSGTSNFYRIRIGGSSQMLNGNMLA
jgi:mRNA interferase RelE/StbE